MITAAADGSNVPQLICEILEHDELEVLMHVDADGFRMAKGKGSGNRPMPTVQKMAHAIEASVKKQKKAPKGWRSFREDDFHAEQEFQAGQDEFPDLRCKEMPAQRGESDFPASETWPVAAMGCPPGLKQGNKICDGKGKRN